MKLNTLIPELSVRDLEKSLKFYVEIMGFKKEYSGGKQRFTLISLGDIQLLLEEGEECPWFEEELVYPFGRGISFSLEVPEPEVVLSKLKENNIEVKAEIEEKWYKFKDKLLGEKQFLVMDPDGYLLRIVEDLGEKKIKVK